MFVSGWALNQHPSEYHCKGLNHPPRKYRECSLNQPSSKYQIGYCSMNQQRRYQHESSRIKTWVISFARV